ncbi:MAG: PAS domain S-box protein [Desulfomonilia bacterium]|nr:PAS domain S-box protein [Desulfomonilia bacterium]
MRTYVTQDLTPYLIASSLVGIGIGDLEGNIVYVNDAALRMWGADDATEVIGRSALEFADSQEQALHIFSEFLEKGRWIGEVTGRKKDGTPITVHLTANIVTNARGEPVCTMDSFVDVTKWKLAEQKLQRAYETLGQRVQKRTEELVMANVRLQREIEERKQAEQSLLQTEEALRLKSINLEEVNTALKVLLKRGEQEKDELEEKVLSNIKELALPYVEKLRSTGLSDRQATYVELLESTLNDIVSPFLRKLSSHYLNFTPTEIQVANLIREGKATKEIATLLTISRRAVEFHRNNIRDKLGLKNKRANLRSYLMTLG